MPFTNSLDQKLKSDAYSPASFPMMAQAFNEAWDTISGTLTGSTPHTIERARNVLARAVLAAAEDNNCDVISLKKAALQKITGELAHLYPK